MGIFSPGGDDFFVMGFLDILPALPQGRQGWATGKKTNTTPHKHKRSALSSWARGRLAMRRRARPPGRQGRQPGRQGRQSQVGPPEAARAASEAASRPNPSSLPQPLAGQPIEWIPLNGGGRTARGSGNSFEIVKQMHSFKGIVRSTCLLNKNVKLNEYSFKRIHGNPGKS